MQFYQRLRDVREDADKTQAEIAALLGTRQQQYARWESGAWQMPIRTADVICFSVENGKLYAITGGEKLRLRMRLYQLEEILDPSFVKINQSAVVNVKKIERFEVSIGGALQVILQNGHRDYVSRRQVKAVKERVGFRL